MMQAAALPGDRLHLQHGPIDLIIGAEGDRSMAFAAAQARASTILDELVAELPALRASDAVVHGRVAQRMARAAAGYATFTTPMIAVAGAVADEVLAAMCAAAPVRRAFVNNGGDIAFHLAAGEQFTSAVHDLAGRELARITVRAGQGIGGIATSGRHGRSLSLGIADSVTVLAGTAAHADAAATLIANAVDLPDHPAVTRCPATDLDPDSDLGGRLVVTGCRPLAVAEADTALAQGRRCAARMLAAGRIRGAALFCQGRFETVGAPALFSTRRVEHA